MKIIVDGFGGDNAPKEILLGCAQAMEELGVDILLSGSRDKLAQCAAENGLEAAFSKMEVLDCPDILTMEDEPSSVLKDKSHSSMAVGLRAVAEGRGDAFASAGNSGALTMGATMIVKRIKGIKRVAFAPVMPSTKTPFMIADAGANVECRPEMLLQFGLMGSVYMEKVMGVKTPRVGLVNVGTESHKGDPLRQEAYKLLEQCGALRFVGNVEPRDIPYGVCDVVVADGFTGNTVLKLYEGTALAMMGMVKDIFKKSAKNKVAAAMIYGDLQGLKKQMDYNSYGGAPIIGAAKPVFKMHGNATALAVKNALGLVRDCAGSGYVEAISGALNL
ncbi:phosphate acyltransferase PlsX [Acutalibacter intestini]|uniref:phosphate acyltransferase PlsX n=1 Tax=Acutalibacter intestini TaxID=3093659 RepID=UPI002AC8EBAF|nr:phosphate acyltransferase PlsX [Acutalibacter sp. M00204]